MAETLATRLSLRRPRNLAALIDVYEGNYFRLMRLVPELDQLEGTVVSRVAGALDLYLTVTERFPYTTSLTLSYRFKDDERLIAEPNARIQVYHDVRAVEAVSHMRRHKRTKCHVDLRCKRQAELNRKWEMNRFLHKWLGFCQRQGHIFLRCTAADAQPLAAPVCRVERFELLGEETIDIPRSPPSFLPPLQP